MRKLVIDRNKWFRGGTTKGFGVSPLLAPDGSDKQCCVGIYLTACGVPKETLFGRYTYDEILAEEQTPLPKETGWLNNHDSVALPLYVVNDKPDLSEEDREKSVAERFKEYGVIVEFIN